MALETLNPGGFMRGFAMIVHQVDHEIMHEIRSMFRR
jgi:hypothetical protein